MSIPPGGSLQGAFQSVLSTMHSQLQSRTPGASPRRVGAVFYPVTYVNAATGNDAYTGDSPSVGPGGVGPKKTIQAGINAVEDGGYVYVAAGTYNECLTIDVGIWMMGDGARDTIIDAGHAGTAVDITACCTTILIQGFTIRNGNGYWAGGVANGQDIYLGMLDCAVVDNVGEVAGGIYSEESWLIVGRCLIARNSAGDVGGGVLVYEALALIIGSTISGNQLLPLGEAGGGICAIDAEVWLMNVTLAFNLAIGDPAQEGGGIASDYAGWMIINTIVAYNRASETGTNNAIYLDWDTSFLDEEYNIDSENSCHFTDPTSQVNTDPRLGALRNNGGPTDTHAITADSPAFDRGSPTIIIYPFIFGTDQRGVTRPWGAACDVGAYELVLGSSGTASSANGQGDLTFSVSAGGFSALASVSPDTCSGGRPGFAFPFGMFSFRIAGIQPGSTVQVTIGLPAPMPSNASYFKCDGNGGWTDITSMVTMVDSHTMVLTLADGGPGDADHTVNGVIVDPGGLAVPASGQVQSSSSSYMPSGQAPVRLSNIVVQSAALSASAVEPGTPVTVTAVVVNKGSANGASLIKVYIDGQEEASRGVTLAGGSSSPVTFTVNRSQPGTYAVYVGGVAAGSFTVADYIDSNIVLFVSSALVLTALVLGVIYIQRKRQGYWA